MNFARIPYVLTFLLLCVRLGVGPTIVWCWVEVEPVSVKCSTVEFRRFRALTAQGSVIEDIVRRDVKRITTNPRRVLLACAPSRYVRLQSSK